MRTSERGYALILVLILLAVGALLIYPTLRFAFTSGKLKQLHSTMLMEQYAVGAAAEHAMWKLQYGGGTAELTTENDTLEYSLDINGITTDVTIMMRIETQLSGQDLAHDDFKVKPWSEVSPATSNPGNHTFDYTINMQQLDTDPATGYIDEVWDMLPPGFEYVAGSSVHEGSPISDPTVSYDPEFDVYTLKWEFQPAITFDTYGQVRTLTFQAQANVKNNERYTNEVALKPNDERAGKSAPIVVGNPPYSGSAGGMVQILAESDPLIAIPNVTTDFELTLNFTNVDIGPHGIDEIKTVLAPGFSYVSGSSGQFPSNMTTDEPTVDVLPDGREELKWDTFPVKPVPLDVDETLTQQFETVATLAEAGTNYVEVFIKLNSPAAYGPELLPGTADQGYSWQSGPVIVPQYDVLGDAPVLSGWGNVIPGGAGVSLESWHVETN